MLGIWLAAPSGVSDRGPLGYRGTEAKRYRQHRRGAQCGNLNSFGRHSGFQSLAPKPNLAVFPRPLKQYVPQRVNRDYLPSAVGVGIPNAILLPFGKGRFSHFLDVRGEVHHRDRLNGGG